MHTGLLDLQLVSWVYHGLSNDNSVVEFSPNKYKINQKVTSWTENGQGMRLREGKDEKVQVLRTSILALDKKRQ